MKQFRFVRVDDRLLHGQVALGWRHRIEPKAFWIVDDEVAADPLSGSLYKAALPEGAGLRILAVEEFARAYSQAEELRTTVLIIRGLSHLRQLCEQGFRPHEVNLGGLHSKPGAKKYLDYIHLTDRDIDTIRWMIECGIVLYAQDLPGSPRKPIESLLSGAGS